MNRRTTTVLGSLLISGALAGATVLCGPATAAGQSTGQVVVIQALPGSSLDVAIDGKSVRRHVAVGTVLGPFHLRAGRHELTFSGGAVGRMMTKVQVAAGTSRDVVLHRPASLSGDPVVNTYRTPASSIGAGKARLLLAHTATVAPADVKFDGKVVFTDIANGEFAQADVPAGHHRVALLPTGQKNRPILGPLDVTLAPRTATMVFAVGRPSNGSMRVIVHTLRLAPDGAPVPDRIDTGQVGLVSRHVVAFAPPHARRPEALWPALAAQSAGDATAGRGR